MRIWIAGLFVMLFIVWIVYNISMNVSPNNHLSMLESWGLVAIVILLKSGIDIYIGRKNK